MEVLAIIHFLQKGGAMNKLKLFNCLELFLVIFEAVLPNNQLSNQQIINLIQTPTVEMMILKAFSTHRVGKITSLKLTHLIW